MEGVEAISLGSARLLPAERTSWKFHTAAAALLAVVGLGAYAYYRQLDEGLVTTGMNRPISWGMYIGNFVFFVSISLAGTLIS
ncbi:MAG: polysulfide reductase, partial [Planctomycetes bacterium]|nr:polysulfide reductase [Planctomycetota bacterium]